MKTEEDIKHMLNYLTLHEFREAPAKGKYRVTGQISMLCWVLGIDYDRWNHDHMRKDGVKT